MISAFLKSCLQSVLSFREIESETWVYILLIINQAVLVLSLVS
jgi:hypothetical protein